MNVIYLDLEDLTEPDGERIDIGELADYSDVIFPIDMSILAFWERYPEIVDGYIINSLDRLLDDFNISEEESLAYLISQSVKGFLFIRRLELKKDYKIGEVYSCIQKIKDLVIQHESPDGIGYLKWILNCYDGKMPSTDEEIKRYIAENEI